MKDLTLEKLEWDKITSSLENFALTQRGKFLCSDIALSSDIELVSYELDLVQEAGFLLDRALKPPLEPLCDMEEIIKDAKETLFLNPPEIIETALSFKLARLLNSFFQKNNTAAPKLAALCSEFIINKEFEEEIYSKFNEKLELKDDATSELKTLKSSRRDNLANLKTLLNRTISSLGKYLQESVYTMRNDRFVVPVKVEHKAHVKGIVHDVSASGSTLFIEPKAIVELNNKIVALEGKIQQEEKRILKELTFKILDYSGDITANHKIISKLDFVFAKAHYAIEINAVRPDLNDSGTLKLDGFRHPILIKIIDEVVPNNMEIGKSYNSLIITGSNTGGKTVILKSVALCVIMAKAGLFVPALEADIYLFDKILVDIGDEQSLVQSLSTFSGHLKNIIEILNQSSENSLVLLDEIGAGTDPQEGSALAQAILEYLNNKGVKSIVTTHYGELKALAYTHHGFQNASVEFDSATLKPTYKLLVGIPGKSNAITIAKNLGLNDGIAQNAQEIYLSQKDNTAKVLEGLQGVQRELSKTTMETQVKKDELEKLEISYLEKLEKVRAERKKTVDVYKKKYESQVISAKQEIKQILDEVRAAKSEKLARRSFARLSQIEKSATEGFDRDLEEIAPEYKKMEPQKIKTGAAAYFKNLNQIVEIVSEPVKNKVQVKIGDVITTVKIGDLYITDKKANAAPSKKVRKGFKFSRVQVPNVLDIRGIKVLDALDMLDKYLDEASMSSLPSVTIIHGHGTGALRNAVREYLNDSPYVAKYRAGEQAEGADGVSIVDLR
ncbi:MAG: endonuclease MutS2 [Candidatus Gastranaerophilales bacterium]|nr:endonuclease MutS2 [Candidatus Gastranaerophilales bacterium]